MFNATSHIRDKNGFEVLRIMSGEFETIPDNARFQANILLGNVVLTNGRTERMKVINATCAMAAKLDGASTTYRWQVGADSSYDKLKELGWQKIGPGDVEPIF